MKTVTFTSTHAILPAWGEPQWGTHRTWSLPARLTPEQITDRLGFEPERVGDPDGKVTLRWRARAGAAMLAIWDYKGERWSVWGSREFIRQVFPEATQD